MKDGFNDTLIKSNREGLVDLELLKFTKKKDVVIYQRDIHC